MRLGKLISLAVGVVLAAPAAASADFLHVVAPGESLSSIAAADGLSVAQLAAANGISRDSGLIAGGTLAIPPQGAPTDTVAGGSGAAPIPAAPAVSAGGAYVVQPGDTLTAIAARAGMSVAQLAALNGLNPSAYLRSGSTLELSGSTGAGPGSAAASQQLGESAEGSPGAAPYPTRETLTASQVGSIASANGVPSSLADAIGWQESGFNNGVISSAGAVGVMQITPGTWRWINSSLAAAPLSPYSASDNVRGGVLMLRSLLDATGGSPSMAAAGYYQGLASVEKYGLFADTERYVQNVMTLTAEFAGG
jgi:LysM repeat protein